MNMTGCAISYYNNMTCIPFFREQFGCCYFIYQGQQLVSIMVTFLILNSKISIYIAPSNCESSRMDVQLCSDLSAIACPGEPLTFICTTVGSPFLAWSSPHYVSESGSPLFFSASEDIVGTPRSSLNGESIGILTKVNSSAPIILESQLSFNVSDQYSTSQIICINTANGVNATTTFNVGKKLHLVWYNNQSRVSSTHNSDSGVLHCKPGINASL